MNTAGGLFEWLSIRRRSARAPALGARELKVLDMLWDSGALSAQQVLDHMPAEHISLSTVQSTLERLQRKHLVERTKRCRAFFYTPKLTRHDLIRLLLEDIGEEIAGGDVASMVSGFLEYLGAQDRVAAKTMAGKHGIDQDS